MLGKILRHSHFFFLVENRIWYFIEIVSQNFICRHFIFRKDFIFHANCLQCKCELSNPIFLGKDKYQFVILCPETGNSKRANNCSTKHSKFILVIVFEETMFDNSKLNVFDILWYLICVFTVCSCHVSSLCFSPFSIAITVEPTQGNGLFCCLKEVAAQRRYSRTIFRQLEDWYSSNGTLLVKYIYDSDSTFSIMVSMYVYLLSVICQNYPK